MPAFTTRPLIMGRRGVVTSGHYLATAAGFRIMEGVLGIVGAAGLIVLLAWLVLHEYIGSRKLLGLLLTTAGVLVMLLA